MLVFDITNPESFYHLYQWIDQYNYYCEFPVKNIVIVGNKYDLEAERKVSEMEIDQFCTSMQCCYVRCSVKSEQGIQELVTTIIERSLDLEAKLAQGGNGNGGTTDKNEQGTFSITADGIGDINPLQLSVKRKEKGCCKGGS